MLSRVTTTSRVRVRRQSVAGLTTKATKHHHDGPKSDNISHNCDTKRFLSSESSSTSTGRPTTTTTLTATANTATASTATASTATNPLNVDKYSFLRGQECRAKGWFARRRERGGGAADVAEQAQQHSPATLLRMRDGIEVGVRARGALFPGGILVEENSVDDAIRKTNDLIRDPSVNVLFEATFAAENCVAKADVIERDGEHGDDGDGDGWHLYEVKSAKNPSKKYIHDMAYTKSVMEKSSGGLHVTRCSLVLISGEYRLGMDDTKFFTKVDVSDKVSDAQRVFDSTFGQVADDVLAEDCPTLTLSLHCKNCDFWDACLGKTMEKTDSIFDLPRLSAKQFDALSSSSSGALPVIADIDDDDETILTARQSIVWKSVLSGEPIINEKLATEMLAAVTYPAKYLDFESATSPFPLYPGVGPFEQIPTQFSLHTCSAPGRVVDHTEFLGETCHDCRLDLAHALLQAAGEEGSIVVYSGFEGRVITGLARQFPQLEQALLSLVHRLFDLEKVFLKAVYHPAFRGRTSIKCTSVLIDLEYGEGLDTIADGQSAAAAFVMLARGEIHDAAERKRTREQLLEYCALDSLAMVLLHQKVVELVSNEPK